MSAKLGEILVRENLLTPQQLREALDFQREHGGRLGYNLVKMGLVSDDMITAVLSRQYGVPSVNLELFDIDGSVIRLIPREVAEKYSVLPLSRVGATLTLAMVDPTNVFAMDDIKFMTGLNIEPVVVSEASVQEAITSYYAQTREIELARAVTEDPYGGNGNGNGNGYHHDSLPEPEESLSLDSLDFDTEAADGLEVVDENDEIDLSNLTRMSEDAPVVRLVNVLLADALNRGASDIHVEPYEKELRIRFRIDGVLYDVMHPPMRLRDAMISRIKIMSKLDIAEKRLPQDGRIKIKLRSHGRLRELDFRVSTLPTLFGEKVVLRLLDKERLMLDMTRLGFEPESLVKFQRNISKPYGMVLVTGPTGSGKTTTLYAALNEIRNEEDKIITIEDPIEYQLHGITQIPVNEKKGLTFARGLRSILRHDPDKIMVGEIRDTETAQIAIQSALTGHLVFTTVHANNVIDVIGRFLNMGVEPYNFVSSLNCVLAQRLIRMLCPVCKRPYRPAAGDLASSGLTSEESRARSYFDSVGCESCNYTGYRGRTAIHELLGLTDNIRDMIVDRRPASEIRRAAEAEGLASLRASALQKLSAGITTLREVNRVTFAETIKQGG